MRYVILEKHYGADGDVITKCIRVDWDGVLYGTITFANERALKRSLQLAGELSEAGIECSVEEKQGHFAINRRDSEVYPAVEVWISEIKPMLMASGYEYRGCHILADGGGYTVHHIQRDLFKANTLDDAIRFCNHRLYELHGE